jgi:hypothetical protein
MNTTPIYLVSLEHIENVWPTVRSLIESALEHADGRMNTYDALKGVLNREMQLWIGVKDGEIFSAFLTAVRHHPQYKTLHIITYATATGADADFDTMTDTFSKFGRSCGCTSLEAWCRKGLVRTLSNWDHLYSVISTPIDPVEQKPRKRRRSRRNKQIN